MDETGSREDAALSLSDGGPLRQVRDPGGLESEGLTLRSGNILRGRSPHISQMSETQADQIRSDIGLLKVDKRN